MIAFFEKMPYIGNKDYNKQRKCESVENRATEQRPHFSTYGCYFFTVPIGLEDHHPDNLQMIYFQKNLPENKREQTQRREQKNRFVDLKSFGYFMFFNGGGVMRLKSMHCQASRQQAAPINASPSLRVHTFSISNAAESHKNEGIFL